MRYRYLLSVFFAVLIPISAYSEGILVPVTTDPNTQGAPDVSEDYVVWHDRRNGNWDIYSADLSTLTEKQLTSNSLNQTRPAVSGNTVVWTDFRRGSASIYGYDLHEEREFEIALDVINSVLEIDASVAISGDVIAWHAYDGQYFIQVHFLSSGETITLPRGDGNNFHPRVSGHRVVWERQNSSNDGVFLFDLTTDTLEQLTAQGHSPWHPDISGDNVVWLNLTTFGDPWIVFYNVTTNLSTSFTPAHLTTQPPRVSGSQVVWVDRRYDNIDIFLWDKSTNIETQITQNTASQQLPKISGNKIVWQDSREGNEDIFLYSSSSALSLSTIVDRVVLYVEQGEIRRGNGEAMKAKLLQAGASVARGHPQVASNQLDAFINYVNGLAIRQIAPAVVEDLVSLTQAVQSSLN